MSTGPFEIRVTVEAADIDGQGHVNNVVYLRWAQDVATAHWEVLAPNESSVGWVVLRHEIDYKAAALLGDELRVRTWVGTLKGLSFERHTEILRAGDKRLLALARTVWCPINPETGAPKRVSRELRAVFSAAALATNADAESDRVAAAAESMDHAPGEEKAG